MLSGVTPFRSTSIPSLIKEKFSSRYRQISSYRQDVPSYIISVISKCIAVSPNDRFGSVAEIINALNTPENSGTVIMGPKPKQAVSIKKISLVFSIITVIMLVAIITLSVNLAGKSSEILKSKDTIAALASTLNKEASPKAVAESATDIPVKTTVTEASAAIATTKTAAETSTAETTAVETTASETTSPTNYNIGGKGPAGGLIFYVNPNYKTDGWKYLEAAPSDFPGSNNDYYVRWDYRTYSNHLVTSAKGTNIGTGMSNTQKIVKIQGEGNYAAKLCDDLILNGYEDWFMPSKDELNLMYENLYLKGIGSFSSDYYWSSSEDDADFAWFQSYANGDQLLDNYDKYGLGSSIRARAVRAFN